MNYCETCKMTTDAEICPACGGKTYPPGAPQDIPCAYCGATPSYAVVWESGGERETTYLCARCDDEEIGQLEKEEDQAE